MQGGHVRQERPKPRHFTPQPEQVESILVQTLGVGSQRGQPVNCVLIIVRQFLDLGHQGLFLLTLREQLSAHLRGLLVLTDSNGCRGSEQQQEDALLVPSHDDAFLMR